MLLITFLCLFELLTSTSHAAVQQADRVVLLKNDRCLMLLRKGKVLKSYKVALGRQPIGRKTRQGDGKTPEGNYLLDARNAHSRFYRSIHISYPNGADLVKAARERIKPGGDIMIHGLPKGFEDLGELHIAIDWTKGCIAVSNAEMDEIWQMVPNGTPIEIKP